MEYWHRIDEGSGECNASGLAVNDSDVALFVDDAMEESGGGCVGCGLYSDCHPEWQEGECHTPCDGGGGPASRLLGEDAERLIRIADVGGLADLISMTERMRFNHDRGLVQVMSACNSENVDHSVELDEAMWRPLAKKLSEENLIS
ncbi:MAG: hypothetical protein WEB88_12705 [Gemmatimonadota bacterium]